MQKTQTACLVILATIAVSFCLYFLKTVLLPFVIALFFVIGCRPILDYLERRLNLHRYIAFLVAFVIGFALLLGFSLLIWLSIDDLARNSASYERRLDKILEWVVENAPATAIGGEPSEPGSPVEANPAESPAPDVTPQAAEPQPSERTPATSIGESPAEEAAPKEGLAPNETRTPVENATLAEDQESGEDLAPLSGDSPDSQTALQPARSKSVQELLDSISVFVQEQLLGLASSLSSLSSYGVLILIFVYFLLLGKQHDGGTVGIVDEIEKQVRKYLVVKTVISLLTGLAFGFVLWMFDVPLAIVFGLLAFLLNYIPNFGPLISSILPVPFLVLNSGMAPSAAFFCFILIVAIQFISGNVLEPRIMGKSFDVSPVVLLLALMFFGLIWGIVGMFLATPVVSIVKIVLQQRQATRPFAELMAGRLDVLEAIQERA